MPLPTDKTKGSRAQELSTRFRVGHKGHPRQAPYLHQGSARMKWTLALDENKTSDKKLFRCGRERILTAQGGEIITERCKRSKIISDKP